MDPSEIGNLSRILKSRENSAQAQFVESEENENENAYENEHQEQDNSENSLHDSATRDYNHLNQNAMRDIENYPENLENGDIYHGENSNTTRQFHREFGSTFSENHRGNIDDEVEENLIDEENQRTPSPIIDVLLEKELIAEEEEDLEPGELVEEEDDSAAQCQSQQHSKRPRSLSPVDPELMNELLAVAGVTRYQAGLPFEKKMKKNEVPDEKDGEEWDSLETVSPQVSADFELAKRLQEEEDQKNSFRRQSRRDQFEREVQREEISHEEDDEVQKQLHSQMWILYNQARDLSRRKVPKPFQIRGNRNPYQYIDAYNEIINDGHFPELFTRSPVRPASPNISFTTTSISGDNRIIHHHRSRSEHTFSSFPIIYDDDRQPGPSNRPTAFQKFVQSANAMINRTQFSRHHDDFEQTDRSMMPHRRLARIRDAERRASSSNRESNSNFIGPRRPLADRTPTAFLRKLTDEPEHPDGNDSDGNDDDCPPTFPSDDGLFAVPAIPHRRGLFGNPNAGPVEMSPAAHRLQNLHNRTVLGNRRNAVSSRESSNMNRYVHYSPIRPSGPAGASTSGPPGASTSSSYNQDDFFEEMRVDHPYFRHPRHRENRVVFGRLDDMEIENEEEEDPEEFIEEEEEEESGWPLIRWLDPENMPSTEQIEESELRKMPPAYIAAIEHHHRNPPPPPPPESPFWQKWLASPEGKKFMQEEDAKQENYEKEYLHTCRGFIPSSNEVPPEVQNTRFEVYIRFPFLQRPLYVQQVLSALGIPDNGDSQNEPLSDEVRRRIEQQFRRHSFIEMLKRGVNIWRGLQVDGRPVHTSISIDEQIDAVERYKDDMYERYIVSASEVTNELDRESAFAYIDSNVHSVGRQDVNSQDIFEMTFFQNLQILTEMQERRDREEESRRQRRSIGHAFDLRRPLPRPTRHIVIDEGEEIEFEEEVAIFEDEEADEVQVDQEEEVVVHEEEVISNYRHGNVLRELHNMQRVNNENNDDDNDENDENDILI